MKENFDNILNSMFKPIAEMDTAIYDRLSPADHKRFIFFTMACEKLIDVISYDADYWDSEKDQFAEGYSKVPQEYVDAFSKISDAKAMLRAIFLKKCVTTKE